MNVIFIISFVHELQMEKKKTIFQWTNTSDRMKFVD